MIYTERFSRWHELLFVSEAIKVFPVRAAEIREPRHLTGTRTLTVAENSAELVCAHACINILWGRRERRPTITRVRRGCRKEKTKEREREKKRKEERKRCQTEREGEILVGEKRIFSRHCRAQRGRTDGPPPHIWSPPLARRSERRKEVATLAGDFSEKVRERNDPGMEKGATSVSPSLYPRARPFFLPHVRAMRDDMQNACVHAKRPPLNCIPCRYAHCAFNGPCA